MHSLAHGTYISGNCSVHVACCAGVIAAPRSHTNDSLLHFKVTSHPSTAAITFVMATTAPAAQDPASSTPPPEEVESPATHQEAAIKGDADAPPAPETPAKKKVTATDIQLVQNLIERCLQLYMSQKEVVAALSKQAQVDRKLL